jgi:hypothetical protein
MNLRRLPLAVTAVAMMVSAVVAGPATAQGSGERLYPDLGSNEYDARSYTVAYDYKPGTTQMASSVDIVAQAKQTLSAFSLDAVAS